MWQKKTEYELREERKRDMLSRLNPVLPLAVGFVASCFAAFCYGAWSFAFFIFCCILAFLGQFFFDNVLFFVAALVAGDLDVAGPSRVICTECRSVRSGPDSRKCLCGGSLEPLKNWKWIE